MSCHIHGHHKTKADVMGVVHVGWSTLDRRVREFAASGASALTPKEFEAVAAAAEEQMAALLAHVVSSGGLKCGRGSSRVWWGWCWATWCALVCVYA
jgi:hypothetical protein